MASILQRKVPFIGTSLSQESLQAPFVMNETEASAHLCVTNPFLSKTSFQKGLLMQIQSAADGNSGNYEIIII